MKSLKRTRKRRMKMERTISLTVTEEQLRAIKAAFETVFTPGILQGKNEIADLYTEVAASLGFNPGFQGADHEVEHECV
jgi:hypothetical protein